MLFFLILALILIVLVVIFAAQNMAPVVITLFAWKIQTNLSVALICAAVIGALIVLFLLLPADFKNRWHLRSARKRLAQIETERDNHLATAENAKKEVADLEEQLASYSALLEDKVMNEPDVQE